jgi:hypothetical protein
MRATFHAHLLHLITLIICSETSCHLLPHGFKYSPEHPGLNHLQSILSKSYGKGFLITLLSFLNLYKSLLVLNTGRKTNKWGRQEETKRSKENGRQKGEKMTKREWNKNKELKREANKEGEFHTISTVRGSCNVKWGGGAMEATLQPWWNAGRSNCPAEQAMVTTVLYDLGAMCWLTGRAELNIAWVRSALTTAALERLNSNMPPQTENCNL